MFLLNHLSSADQHLSLMDDSKLESNSKFESIDLYQQESSSSRRPAWSWQKPRSCVRTDRLSFIWTGIFLVGLLILVIVASSLDTTSLSRYVKGFIFNYYIEALTMH